MNSEPRVYIIDDDEQVRESVASALQTVGYETIGYASAEEFLDAYDAAWLGCIILDNRMEGMSGLELQEALTARDSRLPIIVLSAYADVPMAVKSMKAGAVDVLEKPCDTNVLIDRVREAIEQDRQSREQGGELAARIATLSQRQREVMRLLVAGKGTKEIARDLNISPKTVEKHRANVLSKMHADSVVDLMRQFCPPDAIDV